MDIQKVNTTLTLAIEHLQAAELERLWEFTVPAPKDVQRKYGMLLPDDPDLAELNTKALKTPAEISKAFDKLKPKQKIWLRYKSFAMGGAKGWHPYWVGRKSHSKKYGVTTKPLLRAGQMKTVMPGWQLKLMKRKNGEVSLADGDMATMDMRIYVP